jgi:hypothetical protein
MNPPPLPSHGPGHGPGPHQSLLLWLNLVVVLFLVDAGLSFLHSLSSFGAFQPFAGVSALASLLLLLAALVTYVLVGFTPSIPRRWFLPVILWTVGVLLLLPLLSIYWFFAMPVVSLVLAVFQVTLGCWLVWSTQGGWILRWPLIRSQHLSGGSFRWPRLAGFACLNVILVLPAIGVYLALCLHLAVDHFSGGFLRLDAGGITGIAKQYTRADGKVVHLVPMMHIGESKFYEELSQSIPTNSIVLLEGVSDRRQRLKHELSYQRMAESVGLQEQQDEFEPGRGLPRNADIDVSEFSTKTLELLNLVIAYHSKGGSPELIRELMEKGQDPEALKGLWSDLLTRRNEHLLKELKRALTETTIVMVPWGAAHMPGIAAGVEADGFQVAERKRYRMVQFRTIWKGLREGKGRQVP